MLQPQSRSASRPLLNVPAESRYYSVDPTGCCNMHARSSHNHPLLCNPCECPTESRYYSVDPTPAAPASTPLPQLRQSLLDEQEAIFERCAWGVQGRGWSPVWLVCAVLSSAAG